MEEVSGADRPRPPGVHRRDLGQDQHDAAARLVPQRCPAEGQRPVRPLEDPDLHRRLATRAHRDRGKLVRKAIREVGAKLLFLPKYSPDLNPIEQVFSKLKHMLRKAKARSYDALIAATAQLLDTYAPNECRNYFANAGYGVV